MYLLVILTGTSHTLLYDSMYLYISLLTTVAILYDPST